jgi:glucose-6-phosphate dehydrogenase assembly protein OpcA
VTTFMLSDTTAGKISAQFMHLRHQMGAPAIGMVLTLVVVCEERHQYDATRAATDAAREHPSRIIVVINREPGEAIRLDAELRIGESTPGEVVVLRLYGELTQHADSVVSPLLLPDTPVVVWWPGASPEVPSKDAIGMLAQRRITDANGFDDGGGVKSRSTSPWARCAGGSWRPPPGTRARRCWRPGSPSGSGRPSRWPTRRGPA